MRQQDRLVSGTAGIVRLASIVNRLFLVAVAIGLIATWLVPDFLAGSLRQSGTAGAGPAALIGIRLMMLIGIVMAIATDRLLASLGGIVTSARLGDPFIPANAMRLRTVGWALLALQLLDLPCALLMRVWPELGPAAPIGGISIGGWIATLMVFILARIFAAGSAMRDELAGII